MKTADIIELEHEPLDETLEHLGDKKDVARMIKGSTRTVDNFLRDGLPHIKLTARMVRFDLREVRLWLKQRYGQQRR